MLKYSLFLASAILIWGCTDNSTTVTIHEMSVTPTTLTFSHADTVKTISITHNCTCPFTWNVNVLTATQAIQGFTGTGDNTHVAIQIDRSKMTGDTLLTELQVKSGYGSDTVKVTILK